MKYALMLIYLVVSFFTFLPNHESFRFQPAAHLISSLPTSCTQAAAYTGTMTTWRSRQLAGVSRLAQLSQRASTLKRRLASFQSATWQRSLLSMNHTISTTMPIAGTSTNATAPNFCRPCCKTTRVF